MIPLAIVMETADSGGCQKFWHPPLSAVSMTIANGITNLGKLIKKQKNEIHHGLHFLRHFHYHEKK